MFKTNVNNIVCITFFVLWLQKYISLADKKQIEAMEERFSQNFNKLFYSIGEVADIFGVNTSLIRFWETEFNELRPKKNAKGNRKFTPKDIETFKRIYDLVKVKGFTLDGAKNELASKKPTLDAILEHKDSNDKHVEIHSRLEKIRGLLLKLKK
jgi:DNA-binding transcriptional MerR regulator